MDRIKLIKHCIVEITSCFYQHILQREYIYEFVKTDIAKAKNLASYILYIYVFNEIYSENLDINSHFYKKNLLRVL